MKTIQNIWKERIAAALNTLTTTAGLESIPASAIIAEIPPKPELGDLGFPMFSYAKLLRKGPPQIAKEVAAALAGFSSAEAPGFAATPDAHSEPLAATNFRGCASAEGPYVNVRLERGAIAAQVLAQTEATDFSQGVAGIDGDLSDSPLKGKRIMVEFSSPNTNKPLHLGHLRNDVLGESMARILAASGAQVRKVSIINDRGVHICKSMLAYQKFGQGATPESAGIKSDRFVGDMYVRFHQWSKEDPTAEAQAQELLRKWEAGDSEVTALWKTMNQWAIAGMEATYRRTDVSFDTYYYESQTYLKGKEEIQKGLEKGIFYREADGSVWIDLTNDGLDKKVLLRGDGTALYITQDIGTAIFRHRDWPFDQLIYVVGSEQQYHFKVLFRVLEKLGFEWAKQLYHLSYGMVNLPEGKMKSREGTVVDADDLLDSLRDLALEEIREKGREEAVGDPAQIAEKVALGALHYYLLQVAASKDMLFDPKESLSFNGNTGPYLQYMGARISSMLAKADHSAAAKGALKPELLTGEAEWELVKSIADYPNAVADAAERLDPSRLTMYLYDLSKAFSRFYHDCPILNASDADLAATRLALSKATLKTLRSALNLVCIPFLEAM